MKFSNKEEAKRFEKARKERRNTKKGYYAQRAEVAYEKAIKANKGGKIS